MSMDSLALKQLIEERLGVDPNVAAVYLFGSQARGVAHAGSDVDLGVLYRVAPRSTLLDQPFELQTQLASALGKPVDIVVMNTAPVDLVHRVLRDGQLLLEADKSRRIAFEVQARNAYFDLLPILQRYRRKSA
jgi:predicted nucleotidyltransferase